MDIQALNPPQLWQSPRGKRVVTHWASMLRWIWSISQHWKKSGAKMAPPWSCFGKRLHFLKVEPFTKTVPRWGPSWGHENGSTLEPFWLHFFLSVSVMENMKWYSPSQVLTAKHVPYPQLTATASGQTDTINCINSPLLKKKKEIFSESVNIRGKC